MTFWTRSLTAKVVSYFLLLALLPLSVVSYVGYARGKETLRRDIFDHLSTTAILKEDEINRWIADKKRSTRLLAQTPTVRRYSRPLLIESETSPDFLSAYKVLGDYLAAVLAEEPDFLEIFILTDIGGKVVLSTNKEHEGEYNVTSTYFTEGRKATYVQNVYFSVPLDRTTMTIAMPIEDETGRRAGVLGIHINLDKMDEIMLRRGGLGATGRTYLVDKYNVFVSEARFGHEDFPRGVHTEGIDAALRGNDGTGLYEDYRGVPVIGAYRWIEDRELVLLAEIEQEEAFAPVRELAQLTTLVGLGAIVGIVLTAYLSARQISRPIIAITKAATKIASGDLSQRVSVITKDEVGVLANAFNSMAAQLRELIENLEQRVAERTRDLRASEERFRDIAESTADWIWEVDAAGRYTYCSESVVDVLGYTPEEVLGNTPFEFMPPDEAARVGEVFAESAANKQPIVDLENRNLTKDGRGVVLLTNGVPILDGQGNFAGYRGVDKDITERKRAEESLETYARQQAALFQLGADLALTLDETDVCREVVRGLHETLGYDYLGVFLVDETTGERVMRASTGWPDAPSNWRIPPGRGVSERPLLDGQLHYTPDVTRDPRYIPGLNSGAEVDVPLRIGEKVLGVLVVESRQPNAFGEGDFAVLTAAANQASIALERAWEHQAVKEAEVRYRSLFDGVPVGLYRSTPTGQFLEANPTLVGMLGYPDLETLLAVSAVDAYADPEDRKRWQVLVEREGIVRNFEVQLRRRDGTVIWMRESTSAVRDADGRVLQYEGTLEDITERKRAEKEIRKLNQFLDSVIDNANVWLDVLDEKANVVLWNKAAEEISGYSREEVVGHGKIWEWLYPDEEYRNEVMARTVAIIEKGEEEEDAKTIIRRKDGQTRIISWNSRNLLDEKGDPIGSIALGRDISERKRAEEQLQQYAAKLEQANEEVKQFAYIISHDLRAPLTNLKGFSEELSYALEVIGSAMNMSLPHLDEKQRQAMTTALQEDVPEALGFIESSVTRMDNFINAVLKLSRLGRRELNPEPVDMDALVQATLQTLAHQIEERQVKVMVGALPEVVADRTAMEQIMGNLLNNAVLYLDPGRPGEIEVIAERGHDETTFRVRDNGRGIAERDMDKVFAPFRRAGRQDVPGEGMGLSYVQTLVRRHGGRIWCESEPGVGTTFTFTLSNHLAGDL
jgi:PAS domain S-box-containing protein